MAHGHTKLDEADKQPIGAKLWPVFRLLGALAGLGLVLLVIGVAFDENWKGRFFFAYLIGYTFVLGLSVGSVALVILTHLFRAGWVVAVRRVPETFAANFWFVGLLALPILGAAFLKDAPLYPWSMDLATAQEKVKQAEKDVHHFLHPDEHHAEDGDHDKNAEPKKDGEAHAATIDDEVIYVGNNLPGTTLVAEKTEQAPDTAEVKKSEGYEHAEALMKAKAGQAYPSDEDEAIKVQKAFYWTLLGYMLDYKAYDGMLAGDELVPEREGYTWFHPLLFSLRLVVYFGLFSLIGWFYWTRSIKQDETGDADLTTKREWWAPPATITFAMCTTFLSFDLLMSLDPAWYSTMFGVIFFANSFTAGIAMTILVCMVLQKKGYLKTVNTEHYHDLGKLLFAFVFFWGYVSFSQFMLIWYASLPETTYWFEIHGMTTVKTAPQYGSGWTYISLLILFGHLLVPFGFLLSRHVKRNLTALACAATWMLLMVYLDFYWYAMPFFESPGVTFGLAEIGALLLLLSVVLAAFVRRFARHAPLAHGDPRLHETTALDTNVWAPIHH